MEKQLKCAEYFYSENFGYLATLHPDCKVTGNSGYAKLYECSCCGRTFRGGINGAVECDDDRQEYEETQNCMICTQTKTPFSWYLKQIGILHLKFCHDNWNYRKKMKPILTDCCKKFGLKTNYANFEKLKDVAIRNAKCIPTDIQKIIDNENQEAL